MDTESAAGDQAQEGRAQALSAGALKADLAAAAAAAAPGDRDPREDLKLRQEKLLDEAVQETFPASDPIAPKRIV